MIPILQFDPSSLTFWYDAHIIGRIRNAEAIGTALDLALRGRDDGLRRHVAGLRDPWTAIRAANVASATWHEKRHFLDFVLTNYGAFRMRQFFMLYVNIAPMIAEAQKLGHIVVPIQSWLNPQARTVLGAAPPGDTLAALCRDVLSRKRILNEDRTPVTSRFGMLEIGGEGQLEAIAHLIQHGKVHRVFGRAMSTAVQRDVPGLDVNIRRYAWAYMVLTSVGLMETPLAGPRDVEGFQELRINDGPFLPLFYASLACRLYQQEQVNTDTVSSYMPKGRLASLAVGLRNASRRFAGLDSVACWDVVQGVCRRLFGRTVLEEMQADFEQEEKLLLRLRHEKTLPVILTAYEDFHELRGRLLAILRDDPDLIINQAGWADRMAARLQPLTVVAATAGELGDPPGDYDKLLAYDDPHVSDIPEKRWWWAASPRFWPEPDRKEVLCLKARDAWLHIVSDLAPIAKLLIDGRRGRTMLGPEMVSAEAYLRYTFDMQVVVDPRFAYPPEAEISTEYWRWMTGRDTFRCDMSFETVRLPEGKVLSPWAIRLKQGLLDTFLGDIQQDYRRYLHFWRDWSPYLLNEEFRQIVEAFDDDPRPWVASVVNA